MKKILIRWFCIISAVLLSGCAAPPTIYSWSRYEQEVYLMYSKPDKATAEQQIVVLEEDLQKARSGNKPMHPGFHAHLGSLYYQTGKPDKALVEFETEKKAFPESAVLMDRFIAKCQKP